MDEVEWSKAKTRPLGGLDGARRTPAWILIGLAVGMACTFIAGAAVWFYAPLVPLLLGGVAVLSARLRAFGLGLLAAACGSVVFLATLAVLFTVF
jgi:hypothetical protein